jgi:hypothetical protein
MIWRMKLLGALTAVFMQTLQGNGCAPPATGLSTARRKGRVLKSIFAAFAITLAPACDAPPPDYFPLEGGRRWEYALEREVLDTRLQQRLIITNTGSRELDGRPVFERESAGGERRLYTRGPDGIVRVAVGTRGDGLAERLQRDPRAHYVLRYPLLPGTRWELTSVLQLIESPLLGVVSTAEHILERREPVQMTYRIDAIDASIEVPAGRFTQCLLVKGSGSTEVGIDRYGHLARVEVETSEWYAPDVGLVRAVREETSENTFLKPGRYTLELLRSQ